MTFGDVIGRIALGLFALLCCAGIAWLLAQALLYKPTAIAIAVLLVIAASYGLGTLLLMKED